MNEDSRMALRQQVVVVDVETTGLDPELHHIWEICIGKWSTTHEQWSFDSRQLTHDLAFADPKALDLNHYWDRFKPGTAQHPQDVARWVMRRTWGMRMVGVNPTFDILRLTSLLRENHAVPGWHYHSIDVSTLVMGCLIGMGQEVFLSWNSTDLAEVLGIMRREDTMHTAEGDVRWAIAQLESLMGAPFESLMQLSQS